MRAVGTTLYGIGKLRRFPHLRNHSAATRLSARPKRLQNPARRSLRARADDSKPGEDPSFTSLLDAPPVIVRAGRRHGRGIWFLALMPLTAFALGTWQVQRLDWKTKMLAKFEDRLVRDPLPLPPSVDPSVIDQFDYRRVTATGHFRHDQEMLIGPRIHEGVNGYMVVTPLERDGGASKVLVNRGWIAKTLKNHADRKAGMPRGEVTVEGLLREPWVKNMFTPDNNLQKWEFYFPDVKQMAEITGSQPVWIEATAEPDLIIAYDNEAKGIPIGRPAEVTVRNNHAQYIFTWYSLAFATSIMFWMVLRKPTGDKARMARMSKRW